MWSSTAVLLILIDTVQVTKLAKMSSLPEVIGEKFLYFGFGSNLLSERIHINNPSARRRTIGKLKV
jgi:hypothetical protein